MVIKIHYTRPPNRITIFENELVHWSEDVIVTAMHATSLSKPMMVNGRTKLENGSPMVWFTFPDADHDIARFHTRDGEFTGIYANILTPVEFLSKYEWRTTDLFVDVWIDVDGTVEILDEDELEEAVANGWISQEMAQHARSSAQNLVARHKHGTWPPPVVYDWPIERIFT
jgi:predicted RNA-binding protein associated with RNAse of E/G family